jgi:type IV secretion system protein VirB9
MQLCDIQLEAGETINSLLLGDTINWLDNDESGIKLPIIFSGPDNNQTPHIVLQPSREGLNTTLLITTNKRTYYIKLYSSNSVNVSRAGFYYPREQLDQLEVKRNANLTIENQTLSDSNNLVDPKDMHFNYTISGDTDAPFNPIQVFDDSKHVYIQMPNDLSSRNLPAFYVMAPDNSTLQIVNFRYKAPFFVIDKIFTKGVLVYGLDDNEQKITISKKEKGFWARLFGG